MAGQSRKRRSGLFFVVIYLVVLLNVFIPIMIAIVTSIGDTVRYGVEYDKDPLIVRGVKVINRGDSFREYEISENSTLCEVVITYENVGWYTAEYSDRPEFYGNYEGEEEYLSSAWLNSSSDLSYEVTDDNPVPAGKKGSRRYYVELWDGMTEIIIRETSDKLEGDRAEVILEIPDGEWVSFSTTFYEE